MAGSDSFLRLSVPAVSPRNQLAGDTRCEEDLCLGSHCGHLLPGHSGQQPLQAERWISRSAAEQRAG